MIYIWIGKWFAGAETCRACPLFRHSECRASFSFTLPMQGCRNLKYFIYCRVRCRTLHHSNEFPILKSYKLRLSADLYVDTVKLNKKITNVMSWPATLSSTSHVKLTSLLYHLMNSSSLARNFCRGWFFLIWPRTSKMWIKQRKIKL